MDYSMAAAGKQQVILFWSHAGEQLQIITDFMMNAFPALILHSSRVYSTTQPWWDVPFSSIKDEHTVMAGDTCATSSQTVFVVSWEAMQSRRTNCGLKQAQGAVRSSGPWFMSHCSLPWKRKYRELHLLVWLKTTGTMCTSFSPLFGCCGLSCIPGNWRQDISCLITWSWGLWHDRVWKKSFLVQTFLLLKNPWKDTSQWQGHHVQVIMSLLVPAFVCLLANYLRNQKKEFNKTLRSNH